MLTFIDFETNGLSGEITEICAVDETGKIIKYEKDKVNVDSFISEIVQEDNVIIFWHHFMPIYLASYETKTFNKLKGRFYSFIDFYAIFNYIKQPRYKIQEITKELTGRDHKGNAKDDALDLYECFKKMQ